MTVVTHSLQDDLHLDGSATPCYILCLRCVQPELSHKVRLVSLLGPCYDIACHTHSFDPYSRTDMSPCAYIAGDYLINVLDMIWRRNRIRDPCGLGYGVPNKYC
jgi:hypothetical protein